jgi:hypothetical protein
MPWNYREMVRRIGVKMPALEAIKGFVVAGNA